MAGAKVCWNKEIRGPHLSLLRSRKRPRLHTHKAAPQGSKRERASSHNMCGHTPFSLCAGIHLDKKMRMHIGKGPRAVQMWKRSEIIGQRKTKIQKNCPYINDLTTSLLHSSSLGRMPKPFLWVCIPVLLLP